MNLLIFCKLYLPWMTEQTCREGSWHWHFFSVILSAWELVAVNFIFLEIKYFSPRSPEQFEEANLNKFSDVNNTTNNSDEVKCVPGVFEIVLQQSW